MTDESLLMSNRFELVCVNFEDKAITIKDRKADTIVEIRLVNIGSKHWRLSCSCDCYKCLQGNCDHSIFALYSPAIGTLRDLYFRTSSDVLQVPRRIRKRLRFEFVMKRVLPLLITWIGAMQLVPVEYDPSLETFRTTMSLILHFLTPLVPPGTLI
jgi:hypothetical protein